MAKVARMTKKEWKECLGCRNDWIFVAAAVTAAGVLTGLSLTGVIKQKERSEIPLPQSWGSMQVFDHLPGPR